MFSKSLFNFLPNRNFKFWVFFALLVSSCASLGAENLWHVLKREGKELDITSLASFAGEFAIVGAQYVEIPWASQGDTEISPLVPPIVRKQLYIIRVTENDNIVWRQSYPALPDVHEIFSVAATNDQRLCVLFGEQRSQEAILNPVLLQVDEAGKVLWVKRNVISSLATSLHKSASTTQVANLDTLRVVESTANGCVLTFVTHQLFNETEKFQLHAIQFLPDGTIQWQQHLDTEMYGKLFLINNRAANHYVIIQTNQSRDAAIEAMMLGVPFIPQAAVVGISFKGEVVYQFANPDSLSNVWVKDAYDAIGESFLIAGKTGTAWAGKLNKSGRVLSYVDVHEGEFNAVSEAESSGYLFARGDSLTLSDKNLKTHSDQKIKDVTTNQYINQYLMARLPDDLPVEQMILLHRNEYLLLYKLGSKLLKVRIEKTEE